jgi:3',5'-cyclic-nucleotide phosphodiesterase
MELRVIGCHGGETPKHRTSAFLVDERLAIDAGSLTAGLELKLQFGLTGCLISHAHLDHIKDLATLADNRCQARCEPLPVGATRSTIRTLKKHFFNNELWPDFSAIPTPEHPTLRFVELRAGRLIELAGYRVRTVPVSHTIDSSAFVVERAGAALAYSGDTGPTDLLWQVLRAQDNLKALVMEVSFPNREQRLATESGHHTPRTMAHDLRKLRRAVPTLLFHIKPFFQSEVEQECARLKNLDLTVLGLGDHFVL